jgi:hypothetical protein
VQLSIPVENVFLTNNEALEESQITKQHTQVKEVSKTIGEDSERVKQGYRLKQ